MTQKYPIVDGAACELSCSGSAPRIASTSCPCARSAVGRRLPRCLTRPLMCGRHQPAGAVLPIVDLAERLGFPPTDVDRAPGHHRRPGGRQIIGLLVDAVSDILTQSTDNIQPTPDVASDVVRRLFAACWRSRAHDRPHRTRQRHGGSNWRMPRDASRNFVGRKSSPRTAGPRRVQDDEPGFPRIAAMLYADAGIYLPESKATLVYSRLAKRLRALNLESFRTIANSSARRTARDERLEMLLGADDQRDPILPRAAPLRTSPDPRLAFRS